MLRLPLIIRALRSPFLLTFLAAGAVLASGILLATGVVSAQEHRLYPGRDAFSRVQVDSTDELVAMVQRNPTLRRNYARHFGVPEPRVVQFLKEALIPYRLPRDRVLTIYGVTRSGRIYPVRQRMRKGAKVWATRSQMPVLKWLCGNPIGRRLPGTTLRKPAVGKPAAGPVATRLLPRPATIQVEIEEQGPVALVPDLPSAPEEEAGVPLPGTLEGAATVSAHRVSFPATPGLRFQVPLLPLASLVGIITRKPGGGSVTVVPEPQTLALLAAGAAAALPLLRRRGKP